MYWISASNGIPLAFLGVYTAQNMNFLMTYCYNLLDSGARLSTPFLSWFRAKKYALNSEISITSYWRELLFHRSISQMEDFFPVLFHFCFLLSPLTCSLEK